MSEFNENYTSWAPPEEKHQSRAPLEPIDKLWLLGKLGIVFIAEIGNWILHWSNYALVNPVGSDLFIIDVLGMSEIGFFSDLSLGTLINALLGLAAVATPVFLFSQLIERRDEIFGGKDFFKDGLNLIVTSLLIILYLLVIASEFAALYMRIQDEVAPSVIPSLQSQAGSFWPMMIMSIALIITNAAMGLATAHILISTKRAIKEGQL